MKEFVKACTPPIFISVYRKLRELSEEREPPDFEYVGREWNPDVVKVSDTCWTDNKIHNVMEQQWQTFCRSLEAPSPFGLSNESVWGVCNDRNFHNDVMSYAYVLRTALGSERTLRVLDWGGSVGHYFQIAKNLYPSFSFDYYVHDFTHICEMGRKLNAEVNFTDSLPEDFKESFPLVFCSGTLFYIEHWQQTIQELASYSNEYVYITRIPVVEREDTFVFVQRPHRFGYDTEYIGWCFNRDSFLAEASKAGLVLQREMLLVETLSLPEISEPLQLAGFLFKKS